MLNEDGKMRVSALFGVYYQEQYQRNPELCVKQSTDRVYYAKETSAQYLICGIEIDKRTRLIDVGAVLELYL